jgi:hypothetical protein
VIRRHRSTVLVVAFVVVALTVAVLVQGRARTGDPLDPDNPGAQGAQALARVLADEGVDVTVARGADELESTPVDAGTTVVVTRPDRLGGSTIDRLLDHAGPAARLVVAGAPYGASEELGVPEPTSAVSLGEGRDADCADPLVRDLRIEVDRALEYDVPGCFAGPGGAVLVDGPGNLVLLGADEALTNDQVLRADNAALALRLLGQERRLVWYVPELADLTGDDGVSAGSLVPDWVRPGLFLLTLVVVAGMLWRGRRLGPLAVEPLPVVVSAAETTRSQGRLYRRSGDRAHAAKALRAATRARLAGRLATGAGVPPEVLVRAVAARTGRTEHDVHDLIAPDAPAPGRDTDLITLATSLAALEEEVARP